MKNELNQTLESLNCNCLFVAGTYHNNPNIRYLASTAILFHYFIVLIRDRKPVIFFNDMDRSEAEKTGFETINYQELYKRGYNPGHKDPVTRIISLYKAACDYLDIKGNVLIHDIQDVNLSGAFMQRIRAELSQIQIIDADPIALFHRLRERKDEQEITAIKRAGEKSCKVFQATEAYLQGCFEKAGKLVDAQGAPVTIGQVKQFIQVESARHNLSLDMGFIFSQAQDAALPHHGGRPDDPLRIGETLVFDFGPIDLESDYMFDMTRSYCLNTAPAHVSRAYERLQQAQALAEHNIRVGAQFSSIQNLVCDFLEEAGYPSLKSERFTTRGFTHGLGHGLGVEVHETPNFTLTATNSIEPGHVFTVEPGLYFPDQGWGLRLEDVIAIHQDGLVENLTPYPKNLILNVPKWSKSLKTEKKKTRGK